MPVSDDVIMDLIKKVNKLEQDVNTLRSQKLFSPPTSFGTLRSFTMTTDNNGLTGFTLVDIFSPSALVLPPNIITQMRITFEAGSTEGFTITNAYIGHGAVSGDAYDFTSTPEQILFSGSDSVVIPAGGTVASDSVFFSYNKINSLAIALYANGGAASDMARYVSGISNISFYYKAATNEAATVNKSAGYTLGTAGTNLSVNQIECNGF